MTILPKNKQPKGPSSGSGCNNSAASGTSTAASVSSSGSASSDPSGVSGGPSGLGSVVGVPVSLTGSKRSREVVSSVDPSAPSGPSDPVGPSSSKRRHYHHRSGDQSGGSSDHSDRRRHHGISPYLHLAKKVSGKTTPAGSGSSESNMIVGSMIVASVSRACSSSTLSVPVGVTGSNNDVSSNIVGGNTPGPIVLATPPGHLDLSGMSTSSESDLSGAGGIVCDSQESNGNVSSVSTGHLSPPGSPTGYNSSDEYGTNESNREGSMASWTPEEQIEAERRFEKKLRKKGFLIAKMGEDGACLFRAVADQVYGDQDMHGLVRKLCCDYMVSFKVTFLVHFLIHFLISNLIQFLYSADEKFRLLLPICYRGFQWIRVKEAKRSHSREPC